MPNESGVTSIIPQWTREDYTSIENPAPYAWLYERRADRFLFTQYRAMIREQAGQVGVKDYISRYNAYAASKAVQTGCRLDNTTGYDDQPMELLCGEYTCDDVVGVMRTDGYGVEIIVCAHPLLPVARMVNIDTGEVQVELAFKRSGTWTRMIFPKTTLSSAQKIVELSGFKIAVNSENARELVRYLAEIENLNYDEIPETSSVSRLGWIRGHGFSPYCATLLFDGEEQFRHMFEAVRPTGREEAWMELAKRVRSGESMAARILLAASFASVLLKPLGALPFFVHLWGGTEAGKTVGLMLAASVWADPSDGKYIHSFNSTTVGQEMVASFCNSLPLCIDELQVSKDKQESFDGLIYMLTEGVGKTRGSKGGGIQKMRTWRNTILTNGEQPIAGGKSGGGAVNRVISVNCRDEKLFADPHGAVEIMTRHFGHAGKRFVQGLSEERLERAKKLQGEAYIELVRGQTTEKQAQAASVLVTADQLADEIVFHDGRSIRASDVEPFLSTKSEVSVNERAYRWAVDFFQANPRRFLSSSTDELNGECWGTTDEDCMYINKSIFDARMTENGFSPEAFLSWAKTAGAIECAYGRTTKLKRIPTLPKPMRCVALRYEPGKSDADDSDIPF
ncbi:MAG: DUF927 domain-containing protein [Eubacteriales bacterium]|nr:DUF927 domain-containing protein [Eubacteriales bacterium]